jgi:hypothetical protein
MKKLPQSNENKNTIYQNFWDIAREVWRGILQLWALTFKK